MDTKKNVSLNEFLCDERVFVEVPWLGDLTRRVRQRAVCADGFSLSIQASEEYFSEPGEEAGMPYRSVQIGYPSKTERLLGSYEYNGTYPFVPIEVVEKIVRKHGGIIGMEVKTEAGPEFTAF